MNMKVEQVRIWKEAAVVYVFQRTVRNSVETKENMPSFCSEHCSVHITKYIENNVFVCNVIS